MDATHPVRVVLFWDSEHARYVFGPYFTGAAKKTWIFTRIVTHDELVRKIFKHREMDLNQWHHTHVLTQEDRSNVHQHVPAITKMVSDELSMLYIDVEEDNEDHDDA
ncbi:hypothetical protein M9H77_04540 [Catharanthus roseus]|uniref:Uncharacterized protein n=1 Tax=Catharanthus roseus TaxID=4058 RepID=A0ACC0CEL2_CATRO|nr:hypothetical protein M9H77_04540 [Catharanthus roseus]